MKLAGKKLKVAKEPSMFAHPLMSEELDRGGSEALQTSIETDMPSTHAMRGNLSTVKAVLGNPKHLLASDVGEDYKRTVKALGQHFAAPKNYNGLKVELFCAMHNYMSDEDRRKAEAIIGKIPNDPNDKLFEGADDNASALDIYKARCEEFKASPETMAFRAKSLLDIFNAANAERYKFAKKADGWSKDPATMKKFGFKSPKKDDKGNPTGEMEDHGPICLSPPEKLTEKLTEFDDINKKNMIELGVSDSGVQQYNMRAKGGIGGFGQKVLGALSSGEGSTEYACGVVLGTTIRELFFAAATHLPFVDRTTSAANTIEVGKVRTLTAAKDILITSEKAFPQETPKDFPALAGASGQQAHAGPQRYQSATKG